MGGNKAFEVSEFAGGDWKKHAAIVDRPVREPKAGEVLVEVYLRPVNPTDVINIKTGWFGLVPKPTVIGSEGVARVVKNGPSAGRFREGQRVVAVPWPQFQGEGSWQQFCIIPEEHLVAVADELDDQTAASFWINPVTVVGLLRESGVKEGGWLLQSAATSVLGRLMIALARHRGIRTINVVRRSDAKQQILDAGGDIVIDSSSEDIVAKVKEATGGKGADGAIDPIGGAIAQSLVAALRKGGKYLIYGALDSSPLQVGNMDLLGQLKTVTGFICYDWIEAPHKQAVIAETMDLLVRRVLVPDKGKTYPLDEAVQATEDSLKVGRGGKLYLQG